MVGCHVEDMADVVILGWTPYGRVFVYQLIDNLCSLKSLAPGRWGCNIKLIIFKLISRIDIMGVSGEFALRWMPQDLADDWSTLVQVMAWCRQAPSHYRNQCWPRSMSPNGVTRAQGVNPCEVLWLHFHKSWWENMKHLSGWMCSASIFVIIHSCGVLCDELWVNWNKPRHEFLMMRKL